MDKWMGAVVAIAIIATAVALMIRSWRARASRDSAYSGYMVPPVPAPALLEVDGLYIATTPVAQPLERLAVAGLAFRGAARIEVSTLGVVLRIAGEQPTFVPADRIRGIGTATFVIDRAVERDGLLALTWAVSQHASEATPVVVDSYVRTRDADDARNLITTITDIAAVHSAPQPPAESEASDD